MVTLVPAFYSTLLLAKHSYSPKIKICVQNGTKVTYGSVTEKPTRDILLIFLVINVNQRFHSMAFHSVYSKVTSVLYKTTTKQNELNKMD